MKHLNSDAKHFLLILAVIVNVLIADVRSDESTSIKEPVINIDNMPINFNFSVIDKCDANETCVRFCCSNKETCLDEKIFDLSKFKEARNLSSSYKVLKGRPDCGDMYSDEDPWEFLQVRSWGCFIKQNICIVTTFVLEWVSLSAPA